MLLGAIADDLTGATDLALSLSRQGMKTIQVVGVPPADFTPGPVDAIVVALKSRTIPVDIAIKLSIDAARFLSAAGAEQFFFKYCSTFDSTDRGNIGPVIEALLEFLESPLTIACPAFPANFRTVYQGHLFVGDMLLSDSPMKDHPLTPMTDSNLVRVLQAQTTLSVGLISQEVVRKGSSAVSAAFEAAGQNGHRVMIVDAISDDDLRSIGRAAAPLKLVTGGSGIAMGLPDNFRHMDKFDEPKPLTEFAIPHGRSVILAGSCSAATRAQIASAIDLGFPTLKLDPIKVADGSITPASVAAWALATNKDAVPLIYSSANPGDVAQIQRLLGRERAGEIVERLMAETAALLRDNGFARFLVAGGETSGAVVEGLGIHALAIGSEIDPGIPWTFSCDHDAPIALALKSGNFGRKEIFSTAWSVLE